MVLEVAVGLIKNEKNEFLLLKRPVNGNNPNLFELPGGKVDYKESLDDGLKRLIAKELGVEVTSQTFLEKIVNVHELGSQEVNFYKVTTKGEIKFLIHEEGGWFTEEEALKLPLTKAARAFIKNL
ncbi:NUDIX domain-containing protein [[Mycoplasma] gypis]|uniref:8-oxo-dGTP diphosphatase n=1 Tax=[Mycoplasma] gypis TaxID=92404 RepID=A0ABZ2RUC9_9BACT|nr:NUDIX domain-containing protein [[Mycoplasma] gypis]MBN0919245.1 NUDIX domain-containing protein [[Mycoplasma] gypis]